MAKYTKIIDGVRMDLTSAEETERDAEIKAWKDIEDSRQAELAKKETDKANANQKLKDLGLTDDEIKAIKGIS